METSDMETSDMETSETSLAVMVVIGLMALATLGAWLLSERRCKYGRAMARYLRDNEPAFWAAQPWLARHLMIAHAIAQYCRDHRPLDPAFAALLAARQRSARQELIVLLVAGALVALLLLGTAYWGWRI